jgi:hypothetical protein
MKKHQEISNSEVVTTDFGTLADGSFVCFKQFMICC